MNQSERIEQEIRLLRNVASDYGFAVVEGDPPTFVEWLMGSHSIGETNWSLGQIAIDPEVMADRPFYLQVLAHEVGHIVLGHGHKGGDGPEVDPVTAEGEADRFAINLLTRDGFDIDRLAEHDADAADPDNPAGYWYRQQSAALGFDQNAEPYAH